MENTLEELMEKYLNFCLMRRRLDGKTVRAYRSDLEDFAGYLQKYCAQSAPLPDKEAIGSYVDFLHEHYAPRTVRRRLASLQAFYHYLYRESDIRENPLDRMDLSFRLPCQLPRYIPNHVLQEYFDALYRKKEMALTPYERKCALRNIAVSELLFATGLRISELCNLTPRMVDLPGCLIRVHGKGNKERILHLTEPCTMNALRDYEAAFSQAIRDCGYFFVNKWGRQLSDQSVRNMLNRTAYEADISMHVTPHMFRHSFATSLVNQDVDIRCIQELLGHSSIKTTEIYTHVSLSKQKNILETKNPRKMLE